MSSTKPSNKNLSVNPKTKILLDCVMTCADGDQRPYLEVSVLGKQLFGLLDSGASCTVVGKKGYDIFLSLGFKLNKNN